MPNTRDHYIANLKGTKKTDFDIGNVRLTDNGDSKKVNAVIVSTNIAAHIVALNTIPVGAIMIFKSGGFSQSGWLFCNGAAVSRTTYADLFAVIGTTFGAGNGTTTFNVPNMANPGTNLAYQIYAGQ